MFYRLWSTKTKMVLKSYFSCALKATSFLPLRLTDVVKRDKSKLEKRLLIVSVKNAKMCTIVVRMKKWQRYIHLCLCRVSFAAMLCQVEDKKNVNNNVSTVDVVRQSLNKTMIDKFEAIRRRMTKKMIMRIKKRGLKTSQQPNQVLAFKCLLIWFLLNS